MKIESISEQIGAELMAMPTAQRATAVLFFSIQSVCSEMVGRDEKFGMEATASLGMAAIAALTELQVDEADVKAGIKFATESMCRVADLAAQAAAAQLN